MSYQVLKEDDAPATLPPYATTEPPRNAPVMQPLPQGQGYIYTPQTGNMQQQSNNTTTVVASQPTALPQVAIVEPPARSRPAVLIFAIVLTIVCGIHLCLPAFCCLTPGLIFAIVGYSLSDDPEKRSTAKAFHGVSLCCNIASIVYYVLAAVATIIMVGVQVGVVRAAQSDDCYQDCNGYGCQTVCY